MIAAGMTIVGLISAGTVIFHYLEKWSWISSFYFSVVTLTTVGYGDLTPSRDGTRLFTAIFIILGTTIVLSAIAIVGTRYLELMGVQVEKRQARRKQRRESG